MRVLTKLFSDKTLLVVLFLALLVRILFIFEPGFEADIAYWKSWSLSAYLKGFIYTVTETNYNYPPAFLYFLKAIGVVYTKLAGPFNYQAFWQTDNYLFLAIIKTPSIVADLVSGVGIYLIIKSLKEIPQKLTFFKKYEVETATLAAGYFVFNPLIVFDSAYWGQVDAIGACLVLLSLLFIVRGKTNIAIIFAAFAPLFKLQALFYYPLIFVFIFAKYGFKKMFSAAILSLLVLVIVSIPFITARRMDLVLYLMKTNVDSFPWFSLNAYNLWWIVSQGHGMDFYDRVRVFGIGSARNIGLSLFLLTYLISSFLILKAKTVKILFLAGLIVAFSFFMLPTQMHDRYIHTTIMFLALLIPWTIKITKKTLIDTLPIFLMSVILPITGFYNLHNALIDSYPANGLPILSSLTQTWITLLTAWVNLGLLVFLLVVNIRNLVVGLTNKA